MAQKAFKANNNKIVSSDSRGNKTIINLFKNLTCMPNIRAIKKLIFLIFNLKKIFNYLRQAFIKVLIFQYFDLESHIQIETNISSSIISRLLSKFNLNSDTLQSNLNKSDFS